MLSDGFRQVKSGLVSDNARWLFALVRDPRGLGFKDSEVTYGESNMSILPGDIPPGDPLPYEFRLVMLLAATDKVDAYELLLGPEAVEDTDPEVEWYRSTGEFRDAVSRRRYRSLALPTVCNDGPSSPGGDEARLFWPAVEPGEYASGRPE